MDEGSGPGGQARGGGSREDAGFDLSNPARSFVSTVREVLFDPIGFFRRLPPRGWSLNPVVFALICALISAPLAILAASFDPLVEEGVPSMLDPLIALVAQPGGSVVAVVVLVLTILILVPALALLVLYIGAAIYHILVRIFVRPTDSDFQATLRVVAYTSAIDLLTWIPVVGILASLYGLYLAFVGIREIHGTTTGRALAVISLPIVFFVALTVLPFLQRST
jgi:hypothetical protein